MAGIHDKGRGLGRGGQGLGRDSQRTSAHGHKLPAGGAGGAKGAGDQEPDDVASDDDGRRRIADRELAAALAARVPRIRVSLDARALALVLALGDEELSVDELRQILGLAQASVSEWLTRAERSGLVTRRRSKTDHRRRYATLSAKGRYLARMCRLWR